MKSDILRAKNELEMSETLLESAYKAAKVVCDDDLRHSKVGESQRRCWFGFGCFRKKRRKKKKVSRGKSGNG